MAMSLSFKDLDDFMRDNATMPVARKHLTMGPLKVYVRLTARFMGATAGRTLDIADVEVNDSHKGQGVFRKFLDHAERVAGQQGLSLFVQSIVSPLLKDALQRRGYEFSQGFEDCAWMSADRLGKKYASTDESTPGL
jgi:GNAT superfamily N-acetyltransferase